MKLDTTSERVGRTGSEESPASSVALPEPYRTKAYGSLRVFALIALFSIAAICESARLSSVTSLSGADIWWHLRSGLWILQNQALPHSGIYSQSLGSPWIAVSWAYDLVLAIAFQLLGLALIPGMLMCFRVALAVIVFLLARGLRGRFWMAVGISAIAQYILAVFSPTPLYCSILLFGLELLLLFGAHEANDDRVLFWLAPLFWVWANLSPEFVYGVAALLLFVLARMIERRGKLSGKMLASVVISIVVTFVTPYLHGAWRSFFHTVTSAANEHFPDHLAMRFHQPQDYLLLLLTMAAFLALGLRRSRDLFQILLLAGCASLSFYSQRDIWLVALASIAVIAESVRTTTADKPTFPSQWKWVVAGSTAFVLIVAFSVIVPHQKHALLAKTAATYPVAAADYIREHSLPQPLFNSYEWGGFLMWYQPEIPVAIDGRTDLYSDDAYVTYSKVMNADLPYTSYPAFAQARTILLPRHSIIAEALSAVPAFKVIYQDEISTVLAPTAPEP